MEICLWWALSRNFKMPTKISSSSLLAVAIFILPSLVASQNAIPSFVEDILDKIEDITTSSDTFELPDLSKERESVPYD